MIGVMLSAQSTMAAKTAGIVLLQHLHYDPSVAGPFCAGRLGRQ